MRKISSTGILHVCIARSFKNRKYFRFKRFMKQGYFRFLWRDQAEFLDEVLSIFFTKQEVPTVWKPDTRSQRPNYFYKWYG